jgi:coatomer subunit gamma
MLNESMFSLPILEHQLVMYVTADGRDTFTTPFNLSAIPIVTREQADADERTRKLTAATPTLKAPSSRPTTAVKSSADDAATAAAAAQKYSQELQQIPELAAFGNLLKSSAVVELTESETEYVVKAIKHIFKQHIVVQFDIKNTLPDTVLTDVSVVCTPIDEDSGLEEEFIIPVSKLVTDEPRTVYVAFKAVHGGAMFAATSFTNLLKFTSKEIDPTTGEPEEQGYEDEYQVEDLDLNGADYVIPAYAGSFDNIWQQTSADEASETLQLSNIKSIAGELLAPLWLKRIEMLTRNADATEQLTQALSLQPLEGTDVALSTSTHTLKLYGKTVSGGKVAAIIRMAYSAKSGVTVQIKCRADESGVAALVIGSVS